MSFTHSYKLNPCKCGSKGEPILDSDDFVPCWTVECPECGQTQHQDGHHWTMEGAVKKWNEENPVKDGTHKKGCHHKTRFLTLSGKRSIKSKAKKQEE